jgi:hypothetical protein
MDEVIKLESRIRAAMSKARDQAPIELVTEAIAIMQGRPKAGTRLDALRRIAKALEPLSMSECGRKDRDVTEFRKEMKPNPAISQPTFVVAIWNEVPAGNERQVNYLTDKMNATGTANIWTPWRGRAQQFRTREEAEAARQAIRFDHVREAAKVYPNLEVHVLTGFG